MAVGGIFVTLRAITSKFQADMSKAKASVDRFRKSTVNMQRQLKKVGKQMTSVGKQMSTAFTLPIVAAGGLAVKTFAEFEQEMAKVKAVSGATGQEFKKLESLAKDLGESTRFTASEVATLQLNYSKLGFVPEEIQKITKSTLDLALATGEDLAQSAEVAGGILRAFGKTAEDMPMVVDVMAKSFSSSALNLDKFRDAMKSAAPVANAVGASLEDTTAIISTMVDANIDASTAGTTLRNMFLELSNKGLTWDQAIKKINTSSDKAATAFQLFGKRGVAGALVIAENTDKLAMLSKEYKNSAGAAKRMATIMDDTLQGSLLKVKSALEGAAIELGETLAPTIKSVGESIASMAQQFSALSPKTKKFIVSIAGLAAAAGPVVFILGTLATTVAAISAPILLLVGGIAALAVGISAWNAANDTATNRLIDVRAELNAELEVLKKGNITQAQRKDLIEGINKKYGEYLPNLIDEKTSLQGIEKAQLKANIALSQKIALVAKEELLTEAQRELVEAQKAVLKTEIQIEKNRAAGTGSKILLGVLQAINPQIIDINDGLALQKEALAEATSEYERLTKVFGPLESEASDTADALDKIVESAKKSKDLGDIGGIGGEKEKKKKESPFKGLGSDVKVFSDQFDDMLFNLKLASEEAQIFSEAFTEDNTQSLERQRSSIKSFIDESLSANKVITPEIQKQIDLYNKLGEEIERNGDKAVAIAEQAALIKNTIAGIFTGLGTAIGEALATGDPAEAFKGFIKEILNIVKGFGSLLIAIGTGLTASLFGIIEGPKTIAAGIALIAAATAGTALLAQGGLIFGETLAVVGEGRGTTRSNPEVVAPLDKLQSMLQPMGGGGGESRVLIRGEDLLIVRNKTMENRSFTIRE